MMISIVIIMIMIMIIILVNRLENIYIYQVRIKVDYECRKYI